MTETLTPPSNAYDPDTKTFQERVHARIRADLAPLGAVQKITGTIASTRRIGVLFHNVEAVVRHPRFRIPIRLRVAWDPEEDRLTYSDVKGLPVTIAPVDSYDTDQHTDRDRKTVETIFARMDSHPACQPDDADWNLLRWSGISTGGVMASLGLGGTLDAYTAMPDMLNGLGITALIGASVGPTAWRFVGSMKARHDRTRVINAWNEDPEKTFSRLFSTTQEEADFLDALYSSADRYGISDINRVEVTVRLNTFNPSYPDYVEREEDCRDEFWFVSRAPMIVMYGTIQDRNEERILHWDGRAFYVAYEGINNSMVPLSPVRQQTVSEVINGSLRTAGGSIKERITEVKDLAVADLSSPNGRKLLKMSFGAFVAFAAVDMLTAER